MKTLSKFESLYFNDFCDWAKWDFELDLKGIY